MYDSNDAPKKEDLLLLLVSRVPLRELSDAELTMIKSDPQLKKMHLRKVAWDLGNSMRVSSDDIF